MTSPPFSSVTARQNSREESTLFQILLLVISALSISIPTVRVSKVESPVETTCETTAGVATPVVAAVVALQSALAYKFNVGVLSAPIKYDKTTSLVELVVKSGTASSFN